MSYRTFWQDAKSNAKRANNNAAFKFPTDLKLGAALDKMEAAEKAYRAAGDKARNLAWAKAADAYKAAALDANKRVLAYTTALPRVTMTPEGRQILDTALTMKLADEIHKKIAALKMMEAQITKARLVK